MRDPVKINLGLLKIQVKFLINLKLEISMRPVSLHVTIETHFLLHHACSCQNVCDALTLLLDNSFIRFGTKVYRQLVGIPMDTYCTPLVAVLFLFCYERDFMLSLSDDKQADIIDAFNTTSRYLDDI